MIPSKPPQTTKANFLMVVFVYFAFSLMIVLIVGKNAHIRPNVAVALPLSILPGVASLVFGFIKLRPYAEINSPSRPDVAKMQTDALLTLSMGELGVLFSVFMGGRLLVESLIAIVLFALSIGLSVLPTGLTVFSNLEKNKGE